uniref:Sialophorin n=2 Tax=Pipistrellus kuhlii TaxID=59472 RepID=A0A7J7S5X2_PIPKU|nr:sialophorin [Pipistrellus kuhlii]
MTLLLLFLGGVWAQKVNTGAPEVFTPRQAPFSSASTISGASNLNSVVSDDAITRVSEAHGHTGPQISLPSSAPGEVPSPETSFAANVGLMANAIITQEAPTRRLSMSQEISNATSDPTVPAMTTLGLDTTAGETMATSSLETSTGTRGLPVTMATSSLETSSGMLTSESPVTTTTSSLETSDVTSGPPVTVATSSLQTSDGTSGPPVTVATSSLQTSDGTSGPPVTVATSSLQTSDGTSGLPVTMATSSLETPQTSGSPISRVKIFMSTAAMSTNRGGGPAQSSDQKTKSTLTMVAVLVALLAVIVLLALVLLWRRRQKRRTGALTLNRGGKHNGVVDAWAGPARVSDEEAVVTAAAGVSGGDKGAGIPEAEGSGSGRRPTLTTFFGRRKSRQGSLALEELKAEPDPSLTGEEEPLVGSEDGAEEAPASGGPEAGGAEAP